VAFPVIALTNYIQIRLLASRAHEDKKRLEESGDTAVESIDGINTVTSLGLQSHFTSKYIDLLKGPFRYEYKSFCHVYGYFVVTSGAKQWGKRYIITSV
jgi:ABC-type bacteriocin/lantibiotic exporter with double-glycine peptidase domain